MALAVYMGVECSLWGLGYLLDLAKGWKMFHAEKGMELQIYFGTLEAVQGDDIF